MIKVLIGDDHRIVREGLKQVLADAPDVCVVAEAPTGGDVLALVLLDIAMPGADGLEVLQPLRREHPGLPVLMLSTYPENQYAVRCIRLGAGGYLNKSANPDDMVAAVRAVAAGGLYVTPATAQALAAAVGGAAGRAGVGLAAGYSGVDSLSHREYQVFRLLTAVHSSSSRPTRSAPTAPASSRKPPPKTTWSWRFTPSGTAAARRAPESRPDL
jgi:two-component system, NarL family, invasion response regulator UvrY